MTSDLIVTLTCTALPITLREKFTGEVVQGDDRAGKVNALDMKSWKIRARFFRYKERSDSIKLSSDLHLCIVAYICKCMNTHDNNKYNFLKRATLLGVT